MDGPLNEELRQIAWLVQDGRQKSIPLSLEISRALRQHLADSLDVPEDWVVFRNFRWASGGVGLTDIVVWDGWFVRAPSAWEGLRLGPGGLDI